MMYVIVGILVTLGLISYGMSSLKEAVINTSNAINGKEKIKQESVISWINFVGVLLMIGVIFYYA